MGREQECKLCEEIYGKLTFFANNYFKNKKWFVITNHDNSKKFQFQKLKHF
jgi:hypothetical protein